MMWAVVAVKPLGTGKTRLAHILSPEERFGLCLAMMEDVMAALIAAVSTVRLAVVTTDDRVSTLAKHFGAMVMRDDNQGHSAAISAAARKVADNGGEAIIAIPGDVPFVDRSELDAVFEHHIRANRDAPSVTLVSDREGTGTNVLGMSPPHAILPSFGPNSLSRHLASAHEADIEARVLDLAGLRFDVDSLPDLLELLSTSNGSRAGAFLWSSGVADRLLKTCREPA